MWLDLGTIFFLLSLSSATEFLLGYLTGSERLPGDLAYSRPGLTISGAITLALEQANRDLLAPRGHSVWFEIGETFGEETISIRETAALWTKNVSAYIGPQETCVHEGRLAAAVNLPMISYFCTDYETSDKRNFPTFARTRPPNTQISKSVASLLLAFNWTQVTFLYLESDEFKFEKIATTILTVLDDAGVNVRITRTWNTTYHYGYVENPFYQLVQDTYLDTRIYLVLGHYYEHLGLMIALEEKKLFQNGEYFVVGVDVEQYDKEDPGKYLRALLKDKDGYDPMIQEIFQSYLAVVPTFHRGFDNFSRLVNMYMERPPFNFPNPVSPVGGLKTIRAEAAYLYDAVHLYVRALIDTLDHGENPYDGAAVFSHIKDKHYHSAMGYMVHIDENGDAGGNYTLLYRQPHHLYPGEFGLYPAGDFILAQNSTGLPQELRLTASLPWRNGRPPIAEPPCGFRGEKCIRSGENTLEIAGGVAGAICLILIIVSFVLYRNWRYEQELDSLLWKVDFKDIEINFEDTSTKIHRASHPLIRTSQVSLSSNPDADFRYSAIYCDIGVYKGRVFAIKKVSKKSIDITRAMKKELKTMRDLRHDNLNAFIGACTEPPNICIVTEYCTRGSLKDILENEDVKLDNMFVASLVADILRGMLYLHDSPLRIHGNLKSSNCLVDSRWVVKLADFGLWEFKKDQENQPHHFLQHSHFNFSSDEAVDCKCEGLFYRAPELLRTSIEQDVLKHTSTLFYGGSQKGDVYSFSIILYELHSRHGPFCSSIGLTPADILRKIIYPDPNLPPFRPQLEHLENSFDFVRDCLKECWAENPDDRPDFKTVRTKLRPMRKGMKPNIFDNMMAMMEKHANNLEVLVDERTDQLVEEKKKTEALLYEMLPRSVAEQLKRGNKVEAESFDCVTIYFSDIVGFTAMSAESTPLQVVDFLNDLYTCFDSTIENYDVYKVETIGDAYMVVSGLPLRNGHLHAGEIATMSLHLLENVKKFKIRHRPDDSLQLRIGIHSGPVCAGVVGLKMPRYCLFGDTVNTASRMESTGSALKIHCSKECKKLLDRLGGYKFSERGIIGMKGKGDVLTYWLLDEDINCRTNRSNERTKRRTEISNKHNVKKTAKNPKETNGYPPNGTGVPKSSLKYKNHNSQSPRTPLSRCSSLESPKKLRFANNHESYLLKYNYDPLEIITNGSPRNRRPSGIDEASEEYCDRHFSASCPCIENLTPVYNNVGKIPYNSLRLPKTTDLQTSNSVPILCPNSYPIPPISESAVFDLVSHQNDTNLMIPLLSKDESNSVIV